MQLAEPWGIDFLCFGITLFHRAPQMESATVTELASKLI